jgi:acetyltransferase
MSLDATDRAPLARVHDPLAAPRASLAPFFSPRNVAVIGATEKAGSVGRTILWNLMSNPFGGAVFPINPNRSSVLGIKSYPALDAVIDPIDLAVIVTPASTVPAVVRACAAKGVKGVIVISAGFKEAGPAGVALEQEVMTDILRSGMRLVGPNCLGIMSPRTGLNATFASAMAMPGNVAFLSQSGALCTAVLDWSLREHVGFSVFASLGSMLDVGWGDLIEHLGNDSNTHSIVIYMETIGDARAFLSAAREVALTKPIIVIKPGRTEAAAKAAASHTGSLAGSDEVLDAAFRRCGVIRVGTISELFHMAEVLAKQPRPNGPRLAMVTNAGGPGVIATDALLLGGGELATLSPETVTALDAVLPQHWSHGNPIDILGDAGPTRYAQALELVARDPGSDGLLVILTPQAMTDPTRTAEALRPYAQLPGKPVLASWMGGTDIQAGEAILNRAGIPTFNYPDTAARAFLHMWRYTANLRALFETPIAPSPSHRPLARQSADNLIREVRQSGRSLLTETESKALLSTYGIPTVPTTVASSLDEAIAAAEVMGFPVVLKLHSQTITHKTDVGGVKLGLRDLAAVRAAYADIERTVTERKGREHFQGVTVQPMIERDGVELIIGSSIDPQFGPVLLFGAGGTLVEIWKDRALGLPPLTSTLARQMIERTTIAKALAGVRGQAPVNLDVLAQLLVDFSQLIVEQPAIRELDINPLLASANRIIALDARVVLHDAAVADDQLPRPAIRPYPSQYVGKWRTTGGIDVLVRPIRPEDEPLVARFHETLSERTVYLRYLAHLKLNQRVAHQRLSRLCFVDYARDMSLVVEREDGGANHGRGREILAIGRLSGTRPAEAEFSLLVADAYQRQGLGRELLRRLVEIGRAEGRHRITADIDPANVAMQAICRELGFQLQREPEDPTVEAVLDLLAH